MKWLVSVLSLALVVPVMARRPAPPTRFQATATSRAGVTAKGTVTHEGIVAADPRILPLGSRIRVSGAGAYSGVYVVTDTGGKVNGRHIDIFLNSPREAKLFGKKMVTVRLLTRGHNEKDGREVTPRTASR